MALEYGPTPVGWSDTDNGADSKTDEAQAGKKPSVPCGWSGGNASEFSGVRPGERFANDTGGDSDRGSSANGALSEWVDTDDSKLNSSRLNEGATMEGATDDTCGAGRRSGANSCHFSSDELERIRAILGQNLDKTGETAKQDEIVKRSQASWCHVTPVVVASSRALAEPGQIDDNEAGVSASGEEQLDDRGATPGRLEAEQQSWLKRVKSAIGNAAVRFRNKLRGARGDGEEEGAGDDDRPNRRRTIRRKLGTIAAIATIVIGGFYAGNCAAASGLPADSPQEQEADKQPTGGDQINDQEASSSNAKQEAANKLGVSAEDYNSLEKAANDTKLSVERVKELADYFKVPISKLGTSEAMSSMRDDLQAPTNISERYQANTPAEFGEALIFTAYNNPAAAAQYINILNGGSADQVDQVDGYYQSYLSDSSAWMADFAKLVVAMQDATITDRDATDNIVGTYMLSSNDHIVIDRGSENSGGQTDKIYVFELTDLNGTVVQMLVKNGCFQIEWVIPKTSVSGTAAASAAGSGRSGSGGSTGGDEKKDPAQDPTAHAQGQTADRPAIEETKEPDNRHSGAADSKDYVDGNGDAKPVGQQGDDVVQSTDEHGNAPGKEQERPNGQAR